jgi:hypothetical protein
MRHPQCAGCRPSRRGIAGWAQIDYPGGANAEDPLQKLKYDPYYTAAAYARGRGRANLAAFLLFYAGMVFSIS